MTADRDYHDTILREIIADTHADALPQVVLTDRINGRLIGVFDLTMPDLDGPCRRGFMWFAVAAPSKVCPAHVHNPVAAGEPLKLCPGMPLNEPLGKSGESAEAALEAARAFLLQADTSR